MSERMILMPIELHTFEQVLNLSPKHMMDLLETVGAAAILNGPLAVIPDNKIAAALIMLSYANTMLEQCGCKIDTKITNTSWTSPSIYKTNVETML